MLLGECQLHSHFQLLQEAAVPQDDTNMLLKSSIGRLLATERALGQETLPQCDMEKLVQPQPITAR